MAPKRAIMYIQSFDLPVDEELYLIECDVRQKSYAQICMENHTSPEAVKRKRFKAYQKIADAINNPA